MFTFSISLTEWICPQDRREQRQKIKLPGISEAASLKSKNVYISQRILFFPLVLLFQAKRRNLSILKIMLLKFNAPQANIYREILLNWLNIYLDENKHFFCHTDTHTHTLQIDLLNFYASLISFFTYTVWDCYSVE